MTQRIGNSTITPIGGETALNPSIDGVNPTTASLGNGNYMVFWQRGSTVSSPKPIEGKIVSANGTPVGSGISLTTPVDLLFNPDATTLSDGKVALVGYGHQTGVLVWLFDSTGQQIGNYIPISGPTNGTFPNITALANGKFIVSWSSNSGAGLDSVIQAKTYDPANNTLGSTMTLATGTGTYLPTIAAQADGSFMMTWLKMSYSQTQFFVYTQRFDSNGTPQGSPIQLADNTGNEPPSITALANGKYVVTWTDRQGDASEIKGHIYNGDGSSVGTDFTISPTSAGFQNDTKAIGLSDGSFIIYYRNNNATNDINNDSLFTVAGQRFDANGNKIGSEFILNSTWAIGDSNHYYPEATLLANGNIAFTWDMVVNIGGAGQILTQVMDPSGAIHPATPWIGNDVAVAYKDEILVNTTTTGYQVATSTASFGNGNIAVGTNGMLQFFDHNGNKMGGEIPTNTGGTYLMELQDGKLAALWNGQMHIYDQSGNAYGSAAPITGYYGAYKCFTPLNNNGGYVVATIGDYNTPCLAYYDSAGNMTKQSFYATGTPGSVVGTAPGSVALATLSNGNVVLTWVGYNTYFKIFDPSGNVVVDATQINTVPTAGLYFPSIQVLDNGNFVIGWCNNNAPSYFMSARIYDSSGVPVTSQFQVNGFYGGMQMIATENGEFVAVWDGYTPTKSHIYNPNGIATNIYAQHFDANGNKIGDYFIVNTYAGNYGNSHFTAAYIGDGRITITWTTYENPGDTSDSAVVMQMFNIGCGALNEAITGTSQNDNIVAGLGRDSITGADGNDTISGGSCDDTIYGGNGHDSISGGTHNDSLYGDAGNDTISGGDGNDLINGGDDVDSLSGNAGNDTINGGNGNDVLNGDDGNDSLSGDAGNDTIFGGIGDDILHGNIDNDSLSGGDGHDSVYGDDGNDILAGEVGNDSLYGGNGDDTINGGADNDVLNGDDGRDSIYGGTGNDSIYGGIGIDTLYGGDGNDYIDGGTKNDALFGENGNDVLLGNWGNDVLDGGAGVDSLTGGLDADSFKFASLTDSTDTGRDLITDFTQGADKIDLISLGFTGIQAGAGSGTVLGYTIVGGHTIIEAANSDFSIDLTGSISLTNSDFIF